MLKFYIFTIIEGVHTFHLAMNEFGDLRGQEFVSTMNGFRPRPEEREREVIIGQLRG